MNSSASTSIHPPRITLRLVDPGKLGSEITISPVAKLTLKPLAQNQIAEDLMGRVDQTRRAV
jgi:hypothetical protein